MSEKTISKSISKHNFKTKIINDCELFPSCWGEVVSVDALKQKLQSLSNMMPMDFNLDTDEVSSLGSKKQWRAFLICLQELLDLSGETEK